MPTNAASGDSAHVAERQPFSIVTRLPSSDFAPRATSGSSVTSQSCDEAAGGDCAADEARPTRTNASSVRIAA